jgi:FMN-dependent NADH-azoreductase
MTNLLHIEASPRKERSHSIAVARAFVEAYSEARPRDVVETLDLWSHPLPEFDGDAIEAKYAVMHGAEHTEAQAAAWETVKAECRRITEADKLLFSVPMWNFGVPYKLKHFIDVVTQPGLAFTVTPDGGYQGLITGKPVAVVYSSGGQYAEGSPAHAYDHQKPYLEAWLRFIGLTDIRPLVVAPTLASADVVGSVRAATLDQARQIAREF